MQMNQQRKEKEEPGVGDRSRSDSLNLFAVPHISLIFGIVNDTLNARLEWYLNKKCPGFPELRFRQVST